jgi:hypothetical protein
MTLLDMFALLSSVSQTVMGLAVTIACIVYICRIPK